RGDVDRAGDDRGVPPAARARLRAFGRVVARGRAGGGPLRHRARPGVLRRVDVRARDRRLQGGAGAAGRAPARTGLPRDRLPAGDAPSRLARRPRDPARGLRAAAARLDTISTERRTLVPAVNRAGPTGSSPPG